MLTHDHRAATVVRPMPSMICFCAASAGSVRQSTRGGGKVRVVVRNLVAWSSAMDLVMLSFEE